MGIKRKLLKLISGMLFNKRERFMHVIPRDIPFIAVSTTDGYTFMVNSKDNVLASFMLKEKRPWAYDEMDFVLHYIQKQKGGGGIF